MKELVNSSFISKEGFYEGKRILLDFMDNFDKDSCIFIGNTHSGFLPIASENHDGTNYRARSFRFNAGAIHQYVLVGESEVRYLDELQPGDKILVMCERGIYKQFPIARIKKEIRPFDKIKVLWDKINIEAVVQSNATVCLLTENGIKSIEDFKNGDNVYALPWGTASHLGLKKDEYCEEL